jgi:hypothetical protein
MDEKDTNIKSLQAQFLITFTELQTSLQLLNRNNKLYIYEQERRNQNEGAEQPEQQYQYKNIYSNLLSSYFASKGNLTVYLEKLRCWFFLNDVEERNKTVHNTIVVLIDLYLITGILNAKITAESIVTQPNFVFMLFSHFWQTVVQGSKSQFHHLFFQQDQDDAKRDLVALSKWLNQMNEQFTVNLESLTKLITVLASSEKLSFV